MNGNEFFELTKKTRAAQKLYFGSRLQGDLIAAKQLERELDKAIAAGLEEPDCAEAVVEAKQGNLFTEEGNEQNTEGH